MSAVQEHHKQLFVLSVIYLVDLTEVDRHLDAHREWLDKNFASGLFMVSGPQVPRRGGVILARANDESSITEVVNQDPFVRAGVARYDIVAFSPTRGPYAAQLMESRATTPAS